MANPLLEKIAKLPPEIIDHVYSEERGDKYERWHQVLKVDPKQAKATHDLIWQVYFKELSLPEFAAKVQALQPAAGRDYALRIIGTDFLPFAEYLGADVDAIMRSLGGDPLLFRKRVSAEAVVDDVMATLKALVPGEDLQRRLRSVVRSLVTEARTEKDAKDALMKPFKLGGLGLSEAAAQQMLGLAKSTIGEFKKRMIVIVDEKVAPEEPEPVPAAAVAEPAAEEGTSAPKPTRLDAPTPEDEKEIEAIRKRAAVPPSADDVAKRIEASVAELYAASGLASEDEAFAKRVKTVIANRLRDVRDSMETLEILVQPKELGGLGLSQEAARSLLSLIEAKLKAVHERHVEQVQGEKQQWVEKTKADAAQAEAASKTSKQVELERLYRSIMAKTRKTPSPAPAAAAPAAPSVPAAMTPKGAPPVNLPTTGPAVGAAPASPTPAPVPATVVRPSAPVQVAPAIGAPVAQRPRMEDVKPVAQLTGPVEELRAITVTDFRRLSKDPKEACLKVKDKIDLLGEQSFTKRSQGIAAWNASEVWRTYLDMMGEALGGKPMNEVIAGRQQAKKPALTIEEIRALADLSRQLRY